MTTMNECLNLKAKLLLGLNTQLSPERGKLLKVLLIDGIVVSLGLQTLKDTDGCGVVVDATGSLEGSLDDGSRGYEIVTKGVVETTLELKEIVDVIKELDETGCVVLE